VASGSFGRFALPDATRDRIAVSDLTVRAYNVRFGDAILVTVPERVPGRREEVLRHVLIDVGNVQSGEGGADEVFEPVIRDIQERVGGRIDLYVLTHEHLDHVQGLPYVWRHREIGLDMDYAWLPASAAPGYYDRHPAAKKKLDLMRTELKMIREHLAVTPSRATEAMLTLLANNDPHRTEECVDHVRGLATRRTTYVWRGLPLRTGRHHPFREAKVRIWAPEEDSSIYYGRFQPLGPPQRRRWPKPPPGVDPVGFRRLLRSWTEGVGENILEIDRAANNTSVVFALEWRGWRLLFTGDAELRSWRTMGSLDVLEPVHFLKIGHHGSHNATPPDDLLDRILPPERMDDRMRWGLVSTYHDTYPGVPDDDTLDRISRRCDRVLRTTDLPDGGSWEIAFEG
jgi:beta-lactamase superfamily II metal-dependent hydrolase